MSLTGTPAWINPPNYLGAMEAGTAAGQRARAQDISTSEAADRLRLAYDSLAANERMQGQAAQAKLAQNAAAMELRQAQMEGLQDYREQQMDARAEALKQQADLASKALKQRGDLAAASLDERTAHDVSMEEARNAVKSGQATIVEHPELPGVKFLRNPSGAESRITPGERSPTVALDAAGRPKGYSGQLNNLTVQALMGTNAPAALNPPPMPMPPSGKLFGPGGYLPRPGESDPSKSGMAGDALTAVDALTSPVPGMGAMAPAAKNRVKVTGPNGEKGTIEEGDDLPEGWKLAQ
jgi:hypothetical protein